MRNPRFKRSLLATSILLAAVTVRAEDAPVVLETVRIEAQVAQELLGNDRITPEDIEQRNPASVRDVFAGESSVTTSGGAAIANKVLVNGIEESLLSVTIDGARQNKSAFHHTGNVLLDPHLLKAVEVSKGLAPADAGPGGLGGSLAYETKDAADLLESGKHFGGRLTLRAGDNRDAFRSTLALYGTDGGFEYILSGARDVSNDYEDGDGDEVPGTEADLTDYTGKIALTTQGGHRLEFVASETEDEGTRAGQAGPGGIIFLRPDFTGVVGANSVFLEGLSRRRSYTGTYTTLAPQGWYDPTIQLTYNEQEIDVSGVAGINESFSGTFMNKFPIADGFVSAGVDFFDESAEGEGRGPGPFASSGEEEHRNIGVFAQVRQNLGERFSVSYGARTDWQEFETADGQEFDESGVSGNVSVDVILSDTVSLNAGIASTWGGFELGEAALINFGSPWSYDGFTDSRSVAKRLGLRFEDGGFMAAAAVFQTDISDINDILPAGGMRGANSDLESKGVEATVAYGWSHGFARLNYTYADVELDGEIISTTAYYLGRPVGHILAAEAAWDLDDQFTLGGTSEIVLENNDAEPSLPAYEVFDLYLSYQPRQLNNLELRLDIQNVLDRRYSSRSSDGINSSRVEPLTEPGRSFSLTSILTF